MTRRSVSLVTVTQNHHALNQPLHSQPILNHFIIISASESFQSILQNKFQCPNCHIFHHHHQFKKASLIQIQYFVNAYNNFTDDLDRKLVLSGIIDVRDGKAVETWERRRIVYHRSVNIRGAEWTTAVRWLAIQPIPTRPGHTADVTESCCQPLTTVSCRATLH